MGKKSNTPREQYILPTPPSSSGIVNMHTHIVTTYSSYHKRYKGTYENVFNFIKAIYEGQNVEAIDQ